MATIQKSARDSNEQLAQKLTPEEQDLIEGEEHAGSKTPLLDAVSSPADLRNLSRAELKQLCGELRSELIETVSQVGGHFASSLGVVELTVAIHSLFDTPHDRLVWDVGHQAYIHKMLTGRRKDLPRVRQLGGISGFPRRSESEYDAFGVAHAGTSISAALGMLEASEHDYPGREDRRVVVVIGDGAMTAGMAFEALNHTGALHRKLIVVLNDNEMSIAPNVGALSRAFSKTLAGSFSTFARRQFKYLAERGYIPHTVYRALDKAEEAAVAFFSTPSMLFESFGCRYVGPVDGHNLDQVIDALERAKQQDGPVLIHAQTVKGKGYGPAELDPVKYHGVTPFEVRGGKFKRGSTVKAPSYTEVFGKALVELAKQDPRVVGITAAMPDGTGLNILARELPEKFYDVGIAEQHAVTFAAGLACEGMRPVCAIYSTFLQRAFDQVEHDVCIQKLPVVFAIDRAGLVGADGPTHHGVFDISYLRCLPNIKIMCPKDEIELQDMLLTAVNHLDGPIAVRYPRADSLGLPARRPPKEIEIGKAEVVSAGTNARALLIGLGGTVQIASRAAQDLALVGIESTVVNARFVKPLDEALFAKLIPQHELIVTIEDHALAGGFGSAILEFISDKQIEAKKVIRLGIPDKFIEHGSQPELYRLCGFDRESVAAAVKKALG